MLAQGISMAMYTTYYGLMVAIPHMIVYSYIQAKTTKMITEIDEYSVKFINFLIARQKGE
jgi:biopolymer transport protein ExbB/TolQ